MYMYLRTLYINIKLTSLFLGLEMEPIITQLLINLAIHLKD